MLLHANEVVSTDRLIDELWAQTPPRTAAKSIQVYVSGLRKAARARAGSSRVRLATCCASSPSELDLARFEQLLVEARRTDPTERGAEAARRAGAVARAAAGATSPTSPSPRAEIARLEELRWAALEQRIDADLASGRHAELVGELEALVAEHPLRERLRGQLMLALYRSARQAEALDAYRAARRELSEELGLEPSEELKRLERAILRQDPGARPARRTADAADARRSAGSIAAGRRRGRSTALEALLAPCGAARGVARRRELIVAGVVEPADLGAATAALAERRDDARWPTVSPRGRSPFSSPTPATRRRPARLPGAASTCCSWMRRRRRRMAKPESYSSRRRATWRCSSRRAARCGPGPVLVPFGAAWHDWAALELGAWVARATGAPLRLIGAASDGRDDGRDASRLLADASLIVQRTAGIVAEPLLASPGRTGRARARRGRRPAGRRALGALATRRASAGCARGSSRPARADRAGPARAAAGRAGARRDAHAFRLVADGERAMSVAIAPGSRFAGYRVEALVGRGGMGVVYRATDLSLERPVALKLIAPELARRRALPRSLPQGVAARRVARSPERHPDLRGGRARRAALPGDALRGGQRPQDAARARADARRQSGRFGSWPRSPAPSTRPTGADSCTATSSRRTCSLDEDEHAYLTDFGITKQLGPDSTDTGQMVGTLDYLAPEQIRGEAVDAPQRLLRARLRALRMPRRRAAVPPRDARRRRCGRTCRRSRRRCTATRRSTRCCARRWPRPRMSALRAAPS